MHRLFLVVAALALALALFWFAARERKATQAADAPAVHTSIAPAPPGASPTPALPEVARSAPLRETSREATRVAPSAELRDAECVVTGRVVDEQGQPLSGLVVRLAAYKVWSLHADVPRLSGPRELVGFESPTDSAGAFRFVAPTPTAGYVTLSITPEIYRDSLLLEFAAGHTHARAPLIDGENDLGVFELTLTGAIEGYVRDSKGAPIEGASLTLADCPRPTLRRHALSDSKGHYVLGHVVPGEFAVSCSSERRLSQFEASIAVAARRTTNGVDFVLADSPTLRGVVVDEAGAPIEGAEIQCWPSTGGSVPSAMSAADGAFTVHLPKDEPHTLECEREGFEPLGVEEHHGPYAPGADGIRVVLRAGARTRLRIVDARSGEPLERFGIAVYRANYSPPPSGEVRDYPRGEVELASTNALDRVAVRAPGFQLHAGLVAHDAPGVALQTVRMTPANSLRGRVLRDGEPAAGAKAVLEHGRHEFRFNEDEVLLAKGARLVYVAERRSVRCDGDGRFAFDGLDEGLCRMVLDDGRSAIGVSPVVEVSGGQEYDLGDLDLLQAGVVSGRVLLPPGRARDGVEVELDGLFEGRKTRTDSRGAFRFGGVMPGAHYLRALGRDGQHMGSERVDFELAEGATHEVEFDLSGLGVGQMSLTITLHGAPLPNAGVTVVPLASRMWMADLGKTDANGRVSGPACACGPSTVEIDTGRCSTLRHTDPALLVELDSRLDARVDFAVTSLTVRLPADVDWSGQGEGKWEYLGADDRCLGSALLFFDNGEFFMPAGAFDSAGASATLELVPLNAVALELTVTGRPRLQPSAADPSVSVYGEETLHRSRASLQLSATGRNEARLR